jgi:hypothetical protein
MKTNDVTPVRRNQKALMAEAKRYNRDIDRPPMACHLWFRYEADLDILKKEREYNSVNISDSGLQIAYVGSLLSIACSIAIDAGLTKDQFMKLASEISDSKGSRWTDAGQYS